MATGRGNALQAQDVLQGHRARLYDLILARPGIPFTDLVAATNSHFGTTAHNLHVLERFQLIRSYKTNRSRRYVAALGPQEEARRAAALMEPHLRQTLDVIESSPELTRTDLHRAFPDVSRQTISYRVARLLELGLVEESRGGRFKQYRATGRAVAGPVLPLGPLEIPVPA